MYVYYSKTPWAGGAHTLTVFSGTGSPSKESLEQLMGGSLPPDFDFSRGPACWGGLYDDGIDKGYFVCDNYLESKGERRAYLRNDSQGPEFDLLSKINRYRAMLREMNIPLNRSCSLHEGKHRQYPPPVFFYLRVQCRHPDIRGQSA
jgi:hypothetical protein